jgi:hypothetical protein
MDLLLTEDGDLFDQTILIDGWRQSLQSVLIRIHRFKGEWILNDQAGLDYLGWKDRKRGNLLQEVRDRVTAEILRVEGVLRVSNVGVQLDAATRDVSIRANILLLDPNNPNVPVVVALDTLEGTTRVVY